MLRVPDLAGIANREIRRDPRLRRGVVAEEPTAGAAASASTSSAAAPSAASRAAASCAGAAPSSASSASAAGAGREGGRGERETGDHQSTTERRNETAALLPTELKKSAHR